MNLLPEIDALAYFISLTLRLTYNLSFLSSSLEKRSRFYLVSPKVLNDLRYTLEVMIWSNISICTLLFRKVRPYIWLGLLLRICHSLRRLLLNFKDLSRLNSSYLHSYSNISQFVEYLAEQHWWSPVFSFKDVVKEILTVGIRAGLVDKKKFRSIEGVFEVEKYLEIEHFVIKMRFNLNEWNVTKKDNPAEEIKYLLKVILLFS